jgi:hypothetical protein
LRRGDLSVNRGVLRGGMLVAGHLQHPLHRALGSVARRLSPADVECDRRAAFVRGQTGHEAGQESMSARARVADIGQSDVPLTSVSLGLNYVYDIGN